MDFMDQYLRQHPEVAKDQHQGWDIYWSPITVDHETLEAQQADSRTNLEGENPMDTMNNGYWKVPGGNALRH